MIKPTQAIIVDDDVLIRSALKHMIEEIGIRVIGEALDGSSLKGVIKKEVPDILFLDILMPGEDGLTVLPYIRANYPDVKVIMVTSETTKENVVRAVEQGAAGFIAKPFKVNSVRETVQRVVKVMKAEKAQKEAEAAKGVSLSE